MTPENKQDPLTSAKPDAPASEVNLHVTTQFSQDTPGDASRPAGGGNPAMLEGDYAAWTYFQSVATPENALFVRRFQEEYPQRSITDPMVTAYLGVKLWAQAANEAQALDPKKIRRALLNQRLKGPAGEVRIDPNTQYCVQTPRIARIDAAGRFQVIWTTEEPVRPDPYPNSRSAERWRAFLHDLYTGWGNRWAAPEADLPGG
jgi:urea transport system substrate-binding protein